MTADEEDRVVIAQANAPLTASNQFAEDRVLVRTRGGETVDIPRGEVDYMDVSPRQMVSVATALIPFLEHDDANRAQWLEHATQAVPLMRAESPLVGTGMEYRAAVDAGDVLVAKAAGAVTEVSADYIEVMDDGRYETYRLAKFKRSNQEHLHQPAPAGRRGDRVEAGQPIADGPSTDKAEMALGRNLLVAYMPGRATTTRTPSS